MSGIAYNNPVKPVVEPVVGNVVKNIETEYKAVQSIPGGLVKHE